MGRAATTFLFKRLASMISEKRSTELLGSYQQIFFIVIITSNFYYSGILFFLTNCCLRTGWQHNKPPSLCLLTHYVEQSTHTPTIVVLLLLLSVITKDDIANLETYMQISVTSKQLHVAIGKSKGELQTIKLKLHPKQLHLTIAS